MSYIRATYNSGSVISVDDSSLLASNYEIWWETDEYVTDNSGVWYANDNVYIPDGIMYHQTNWIWRPEDPWSDYNG